MNFFRVFCLAALLGLGLTFSAQAGEAVVGSEITVDVTGKDAADARSQAMAKAEGDALTALLIKLTPTGQAEEIVANLDPRRISAMVKGTEVLDEKISGNRYRARLLISFDADAISTLIGKFSASDAKGDIPLSTGSFLIIPAYEDENGLSLWEDSNPWLPIWRQLALELNSGDIVVPYGDNTDVNIIDSRNMTSATYASLAPLTLRYGISDVVILQAKYTLSPEMGLTVVKRRINRSKNEVNMLTYRADLQETRDTLMARAARDIAENLQSKKTEELSSAAEAGPGGGERHKVMLLASITTMASWTELRTKLSSLPMIDRLELLAMSPHQVDMIVHYRGSPESLANGIIAQGMRLAQNPQYWVISRD